MKKEIREQAKRIASRFGKTHEQKEDIEGRCLEAAWQVESKIREDGHPEAFLDKVMQNVAINYLRQQSKIKEVPISTSAFDFEDIVEPKNMEDSIIDSIIIQDEVPEMLAGIKSPDKEILMLLMKGYNQEEIAKELNMRTNSITVRIHRNKKKWKDLIKV